jgi:hypothetical protein
MRRLARRILLLQSRQLFQRLQFSQRYNRRARKKSFESLEDLSGKNARFG